MLGTWLDKILKYPRPDATKNHQGVICTVTEGSATLPRNFDTAGRLPVMRWKGGIQIEGVILTHACTGGNPSYMSQDYAIAPILPFGVDTQ